MQSRPCACGESSRAKNATLSFVSWTSFSSTRPRSLSRSLSAQLRLQPFKSLLYYFIQHMHYVARGPLTGLPVLACTYTNIPSSHPGRYDTHLRHASYMQAAPICHPISIPHTKDDAHSSATRRLASSISRRRRICTSISSSRRSQSRSWVDDMRARIRM